MISKTSGASPAGLHHPPSQGHAGEQPGPLDAEHLPQHLSDHDARGEVRFLLQRVTGGLYVEREERPLRGLHTLQSVCFAEPSDFLRWCQADPLRFEHPLLHARLLRLGAEFGWTTRSAG